MTDENKKSIEDDQSRNPKSGEDTGSIEDLMLDVAWKDFSSAYEEKRVLDTKANIILVANGVLLGLVINGLSKMDQITAYFAVTVIIFSSICCIFALYLRPYKSLGAMNTWNALKDNNVLKNVPQAKRNIMATIDAAVKHKRDQSKKIGGWIKIANLLFVTALVLIATSLIIHYFNSICICNLN